MLPTQDCQIEIFWPLTTDDGRNLPICLGLCEWEKNHHKYWKSGWHLTWVRDLNSYSLQEHKLAWKMVWNWSKSTGPPVKLYHREHPTRGCLHDPNHTDLHREQWPLKGVHTQKLHTTWIKRYQLSIWESLQPRTQNKEIIFERLPNQNFPNTRRDQSRNRTEPEGRSRKNWERTLRNQETHWTIGLNQRSEGGRR